MNPTASLRVALNACILLISLSPIGFGEVSEYDLSRNLQDPFIMEDLRSLHSSEDLLANLSRQIDLNETVISEDLQSIQACALSLNTYESILRERAICLARFELKINDIWSSLCLQERVRLTEFLEEQLRRQAILIYDFQSQLKKKYCLFSMQDKEKFLTSFQDLLDRETSLLIGFEHLLHQLQNAPKEDEMGFLGSFEDLIRRHAILLDIYKDFLRLNCDVIKIYKYVEEYECYRAGQNANYTYVIKNTCNCSFDEVDIVDSRLGVVIKGISLAPYEMKSFNKTTIMNYLPGTKVCNNAWIVDPNGFTLGWSNEVCIRMCPPDRNQTYGIPEPLQYGQYCENQKVVGTGIIDISASIVDKEIALEYSNSLSGKGDIELESENAFSESASKLQRSIGNNTTSLNFYENIKLAYSGETPLSGGKYLESREFLGGIGASIQESFSVDKMLKDQQTFFASTDPISNEIDPDRSNQLRNESSTHLVAIETKNSFNGTWVTDSLWHKILYKDIKAHELFTGGFEAEKTIKFHKNPVAEKKYN